MSSRLLEIGVTNAILALLVATIVLLVARWRPNAHLEAVLWLVVLIKFVMPPLVPFSVAIPAPPSTEAQPSASIDAEAGPAPISPRMPVEMAMEKPAASADRAASIAPAGSPAPAPAPLPAAAPAVASTSPPTAVPDPRFLSALKDWFLARWTTESLVWIWLGGAWLAATVLATRAYRFHRLICGRAAREPDAQLQSAFGQLCQAMGIRRIPWLRVVEAEVSPLIWSWLGRTIVLLPQSLLRTLTVEQRSMVLAHELAHIRRHDHWVRWLEALVQSVYWCFPPVRWIRHRLHAAQEECCDAWVIANFPGRQAEYCDALLAAASGMAAVRPSLILASEFGRGSTLKLRVEAVLHQSLPRPLTNRGRSTCLATGLLLLAVSVRWVIADSPKQAPQPKSEPAQSTTQSTTQFLVTDAKGRPIVAGEAHVRGYTRMGDFFEQTFPIDQGKAVVPLKSPELDQMTIQLETPGYLSYFKEYRRGNGQAFFALAGQYKFQLKPGITIGGKIVDADGKPVRGARVYACSSSGAPIESGFHGLEKTVYTNADGEWKMSGAPADAGNLGLRIYGGRDFDGGTNFRVLPEQVAGLKALKDVRTLTRAATGVTISGTVVDRAGKPVQGAMVLLEGRNFYRDYGHNIPKTDAAGSFSITAVPPGKHELTIFSIDWALKSVKFSVPQQEPLKIVVEKGKRVEFRTVDEQGHPIAGIRFHPQAPRNGRYDGDAQVLDFLGNRDLIKNKSDSRGVFVWENAPSEPLGYQIGSARVLSLPAGDYGPAGSPHTLVFRYRIPIHVKVIDAASGEPIKSYRIYEGGHFRLNSPGFWEWNLQRPSRAKPGGFDDSLKNLDRLIQYRIQADGYRPTVSDTLDAQKLPDKPISIEFRLEKDTGYSAVVRTPDGQSAAGAKVYTVTKRRGDYRGFEVLSGVANKSTAATFTTADVEGEIRIAPSSDPFLCFISHESGYAELMDVDLFQNSKISLVPWGRIEGVLSLRGKPAGDIAVQLRKDNAFAMESELPGVSYVDHATTDSAGRYRFDRCVAGQWNEDIFYYPAPPQPTFGDRSSLTVDIAPGQALLQHIGQTGTDLQGRISLPKGAAVDWDHSRLFLTLWESRIPPDTTAKVWMNYRRFKRRWDFRRVDKDGSFRFFNLEPADYELDVSVLGPGDEWFRPTYSKKITIARKMFLGKTPTNSIDLGDIPVSAAAR
jgi:beta-lactamase regulating signal transducer with metallopeptidase domain